MSQICVVVTNGARARFFTLEPPEHPEFEPGPNLVEHKELLNPDMGSGLWSELKTGRNRAGRGGPAHGYDDHRTQHQEEYERRFAQSVAETCCQLSKSCEASDVILVSQKRMLGYLRNAMHAHVNGFNTRELAKDLSKLSPAHLHEYLAKAQLLPRRRQPS